MKFVVIAVLSLGLVPISYAVKVAPTLPGPTIDQGFTDASGKPISAVELIKAHQTNTACRKELADAISVYQAAKANLHELARKNAGHDAVDTAERKMRQVREPMLEKIEQCGPCMTHEMTKPIQITGSNRKRQVWWVSDGSCQIEGDAETIRSAYQKISTSLLHLHQYAKKPLDPGNPDDDGGFYNVLQFLAVDKTNAKALPEVDNLDPKPNESEHPPLYAYVVVRGIEAIPSLESFGYFFRDEFKTIRQPNGNGSLYMTFNAKSNDGEIAADGQAPPMPAGFEEALHAQLPVQDVTAGGTKLRTFTPEKLGRIMGSWYLTSDGYLRYYTAADFGILGLMQPASHYARAILRDTIVQTLERAVVLK